MVKAHPVMQRQHCLCVQKHAEWLLSQLTAHMSATTKHPAAQRAACGAVGLHHASLWAFHLGRASRCEHIQPPAAATDQPDEVFSLQIHANLCLFAADFQKPTTKQLLCFYLIRNEVKITRE